MRRHFVSFPWQLACTHWHPCQETDFFSTSDVCDWRKNIFLYYLYFRFFNQWILLDLGSDFKLIISYFFFSCGKTTQIPQFILDSHLKAGHGGECFIICTQPRRISAMSVAERVSSERVDKIGQSVGYQVRLENKQVHLCLQTPLQCNLDAEM